MSQRVTLDDTDMRARMRPLRHVVRSAAYAPRPGAAHSRKLFQDIGMVDGFQLPQEFTKSTTHTPMLKASVAGRKNASPTKMVDVAHRRSYHVAAHKPEHSKVLRRESFIPSPVITEPFIERTFEPAPKVQRMKMPRLSKKTGMFGILSKSLFRLLPARQKLLVGLAAIVFLIGSGVTLSGLRTNHLGQIGAAKASVAAAVPATTTNSTDGAPSTAPVTTDTLRSYQVAPEAPRYIRIAKYGVIARVLQVGVTKDGALATPSNVFDSAWYRDSALPGNPGATLIDGHVSSWETNGVFYDIKNLVAGDSIEIEKGDGAKLEYSVVKVTRFPKDAVDMKSLMIPITAGTSGLNLITCGGKYDKESNQFSERIAVYATLK